MMVALAEQVLNAALIAGESSAVPADEIYKDGMTHTFPKEPKDGAAAGAGIAAMAVTDAIRARRLLEESMIVG